MIRFTTLCLLLPLAATAEQPASFDCENSPEHSKFDFWVGDWEVTNKPGDKVYGTNRISKREKGCLLLEEYETDHGFSGSSINFYHPANGKWHQHWIDNGTSIIQTEGGIELGSMVMQGTIYYLASKRSAPFRGRWTPLKDGRVRQFFEEQDDQGQWQTWFDGYYRRLE
jgi:hypothetical protein